MYPNGQDLAQSRIRSGMENASPACPTKQYRHEQVFADIAETVEQIKKELGPVMIQIPAVPPGLEKSTDTPSPILNYLYALRSDLQNIRDSIRL